MQAEDFLAPQRVTEEPQAWRRLCTTDPSVPWLPLAGTPTPDFKRLDSLPGANTYLLSYRASYDWGATAHVSPIFRPLVILSQRQHQPRGAFPSESKEVVSKWSNGGLYLLHYLSSLWLENTDAHTPAKPIKSGYLRMRPLHWYIKNSLEIPMFNQSWEMLGQSFRPATVGLGEWGWGR